MLCHADSNYFLLLYNIFIYKVCETFYGKGNLR